MHADGYASLIMEELDPDHNGYIEVRSEKFLLLSNFIEFYINLHLSFLFFFVDAVWMWIIDEAQ